MHIYTYMCVYIFVPVPSVKKAMGFDQQVRLGL